MSKQTIIDTNLYLSYINAGCSDELLNGDYLILNDKFAIKVVYTTTDIWYEVDQEPLLEGCYIYATNSFKGCLDWCNENLNTNILYY